MQSNVAPRGMVVTPHHLATESALAILREGGTAMEATVAAAATIAVVYPNMNSIGGDSFWLIVPPHGDPIVIEACGAAGSLATDEFFEGYTKIPYTGVKSAITVAGTIGGWQEALNYVAECGYQKISTSRLLVDAITYAEDGYPITRCQIDDLEKVKGLKDISEDFKRIYLPYGRVPKLNEKFCQKELARTLKHLAENGLNSFYTGELAKIIADDMSCLGMPITELDLARYCPVRKTPLRLIHKYGEVYNLPPPTQGLVSLSVLGILDKLEIDGKSEGEFIHCAVEATKQGFQLRDHHITDPKYMKCEPESLLSTQSLNKMANNVNLDLASSVGKGKGPGDTIWLGVMDDKGFSVSFIQSIYHKFGSGIVLPKTGILWHDRGAAFTLDKNNLLSLYQGKKPFHTLNVAAAKLYDGRVMIYGTRGGDGQPQTQAAIFHRYVVQGQELQTSISGPRWVYGSTYGDLSNSLKLEGRFGEATIKYLKERGHDIEMLDDFCETVGHAGVLVRHSNGFMEGAFDPRSNGSAAGF